MDPWVLAIVGWTLVSLIAGALLTRYLTSSTVEAPHGPAAADDDDEPVLEPTPTPTPRLALQRSLTPKVSTPKGNKSKTPASTPSKATQQAKERPTSAVMAFLSKLALIQYKDCFAAHGYISTSDIATCSVQDLIEMGIKKGHATRIVSVLHPTSKDDADAAEGIRPAVTKRSRFRYSVFMANDKIDYDGLPILKGTLMKRSSRKLGGWQKRWFETEGAYLKYYNTASRKRDKLLAAIDLRQCHRIVQRPDLGEAEFEIDTADRQYRLVANTPFEAERWVAGLIERQHRLWGLSDTANSTLKQPKPDYSIREDEQSSVRRLVRLVPDCSEQVAVRFLRARDHDISAAGELLQKHMAWRKQQLPIPLTKGLVTELNKAKYMFYNGVDRSGHKFVLVNSARMGKHTYKSLDIALKAMIFALERLCADVLGPTDKFTVIFDRGNTTLKNLDLDWAKRVGAILQDNYPERLHQALICPAGLGFRGAWNICKGFFDPKTVDKVKLLPELPDLLDFVDPDQLTVGLGGESPVRFDLEQLVGKRGSKLRTPRRSNPNSRNVSRSRLPGLSRTSTQSTTEAQSNNNRLDLPRRPEEESGAVGP